MMYNDIMNPTPDTYDEAEPIWPTPIVSPAPDPLLDNPNDARVLEKERTKQLLTPYFFREQTYPSLLAEAPIESLSLDMNIELAGYRPCADVLRKLLADLNRYHSECDSAETDPQHRVLRSVQICMISYLVEHKTIGGEDSYKNVWEAVRKMPFGPKENSRKYTGLWQFTISYWRRASLIFNPMSAVTLTESGRETMKSVPKPGKIFDSQITSVWIRWHLAQMLLRDGNFHFTPTDFKELARRMADEGGQPIDLKNGKTMDALHDEVCDALKEWDDQGVCESMGELGP